MRADHDLQKLVLEQLDCDPQVNSSHIGVIARNGLVTLTGHVPTLAEKVAAETSAGMVRGVRAVVDQLVVEPRQQALTSDEVIADRASARLATNSAVPAGRLHVSVSDGIVTVRGRVDWQFQRDAARDDLHRLDGIRRVVDEVEVASPIGETIASDIVQKALGRVAPPHCQTVTVSCDGTVVTLSGTIPSWYERSAAEQAAWTVPGVSAVVNDIVVA
jgi:osmotically-inducible protein OsmY